MGLGIIITNSDFGHSFPGNVSDIHKFCHDKLLLSVGD